MKKHAFIPAMLTVLFLASSCTLPAVKDPSARTSQITTSSKGSPPEKTAPAVLPETKGKRISLIPKADKPQTTEGTVPEATATPPQEAVPPAVPQTPPAPQPHVFTDYNTGLSFTYQKPWRLISTQGEGPILGRDGHSQVTVRFATLTTDKDKGAQIGYFYVPDDSLVGTIGTTIRAMLGAEDKQATQGKTPLDVLLTKKHFPNLIIEKRYRGNNGGVVVQRCRYKDISGTVQVYHIFLEDKVASFSLSEANNRQIKLEMQQIVLSTKKQ